MEIKSVDDVPPIAHAQMITYLRLLDLEDGLLINFNVARLVDGVRRFLNTPRPIQRGHPQPAGNGPDEM